MLAEIVRSVDSVSASIGLDNVAGAVVCGVPLTVESESRAGTMNPARNIKAECVGKGLTSSLVKREPVSGAIGLSIRSAVRQAVRAHVAHTAEGHENDFLHPRTGPVFGFGDFPVSPEAGFLTLNGDSPRSGSSPVAGVSSVIQHFLQGLHMKEIIANG